MSSGWNSGYPDFIGAKLARQPNVQAAVKRQTALAARRAARILDTTAKERTGASRVEAEHGKTDGYIVLSDARGGAYGINRDLRVLSRAVRGR